MRRAVFLDRDGTLVRERHYLARAEALELYAGAAAGLRRLAEAGWALVLVTNQSGLARGLFGEAELAAVHAALERALAAEGVVLDGIYYCPHHPEGSVARWRRVCDCRKPAPGMIRRATEELGLELGGSWIVGDKASDMALGARLGLGRVLVLTGYGAASARSGLEPPPDAVAPDLAAAARWILEREAGA